MENVDMAQFEQNQGLIAALFGGIGLGLLIFYFLIVLLMIISMWKVFEKAGKPGWAAIVPIYNLVILLEIVRKPIWWIILLLIPFVNLIVIIILYIELAKVFGQGGGFAVGLILLGIIFIPILAFGDAKYVVADNNNTPDSN
ncbi:MAG: DUF5684 domain-containing protein [Bacteroidetes bacterium]|jgi:hypothetical protein|nr:DUF5684 domain-containing protein [Bacteroidota bacterium]